MLQITDDSKSEWNINETHIIIPMMEGDGSNVNSDKILSNTVTLGAVENGDQVLLNNSLEHNFVIGLDKNLFPTSPYKSEIVIIQNPNSKNPVSYTLSYIDQDKCDFSNDRAVLEVRDILNYDGSVHDLGITNDQIILEESSELKSTINYTKNSSESQTTRYRNEIKTNLASLATQKSVSQISKKVGALQKTETVQKNVKSDSSQSDISSTEKNDQNSCCIQGTTAKDLLSTSNNFMKYENEEKSIDCKNIGARLGLENENLPEKSLPLKKKAKMKRTVAISSAESPKSIANRNSNSSKKNSNNPMKRRKQEVPKNELDTKSEFNLAEPETKLLSKSDVRKNSNEKVVKIGNDCSSLENTSTKIDIEAFKFSKFTSMFDLVEGLRKCRIINATVWKILNTGLKEIDIDLLKEIMDGKTDENLNNRTYSAQLKAFALILYFKQPAAFNFLSQIYKAGWPSLAVIKDWKVRLNSHLRAKPARNQLGES